MIHERFKKQLEADRLFLKDASVAQKAGDFVRAVAPHLAVLAGSVALNGAVSYAAARDRFKKHQTDLEQSYKQLSSGHADFRNNPNQFHQRFTELALISPAVASNAPLAGKLISARMTNGFDLDDVHRLSSIEYNSVNTSRAVSPEVAGKATAMTTLQNLLQSMGPSMISQTIKSVADMPKIRAEEKRMRDEASLLKTKKYIRDNPLEALPKTPKQELIDRSSKNKKFLSKVDMLVSQGVPQDLAEEITVESFMNFVDMQKKSSADLYVSEECLGRMLGDAHVMYTQSGIHKEAASGNIVSRAFSSVGKALAPSASHAADYFKYMAVPLAIGGGIQLVNKLMQMKETAQMRAQADQVYAGLMRTNEYVKENPEEAAAAFDALRSFAPSLATKPMIAKTFVEHVVNTGGKLPPEMAQQLAATEKLVSDMNRTTGGGFIAGLKEPISGIFGHKVGILGAEPRAVIAARMKPKV